MQTQTLSGSTATPWIDAKRYWWLLSPAIPAVGLASVVTPLLGGPLWALWALPIVLYVLLPIMDALIGEDRVNAPESAVSQLEDDFYYRLIVFAYIPVQYATTIGGVYLAATGNLPWWAMIALIGTTGITNGVAINTAHELGHKTNALERWLAKIALAPVAYGHFFIEHNKGHHKNVATPEDPASSRMGETFWAFIPRTVIGSARSGWNIEKDRLQRLGKSVWSRENENLQAWGMTVVMFGALTLWLGSTALLFLIAQAIFGFLLLEVVNYLEHYGLLRQKLPSGRYERCQPRHSWNSNHVVSNLVLYQLQRHSDHHANPTRRYQALRHFEDSPQLPSGYGGMIVVAYFPWLWFKLMDHRVVAHHGGDLSKANLHPAKREALLRKWAHAMPQNVGSSRPVASDAVASNDDTSDHQCPNCQYVYRAEIGCPHEGYPAGTLWSALPMNWQCPQCAVREKPDFVAISPDQAEAVA